MKKNQNTPLRFKKLNSAEELKAALKLRYEVYNETYPLAVDHASESHLEADEYDLHALHFGLFQNEELVGYTRLLFDKRFDIPEKYGPHSEDALLPVKLTLMNSKSPNSDLYSYYLSDLEHSRQQNVYQKWFTNRSSKKYPVVEVSRLILRKDFRSHGLGRQMIAAVFSLFPALTIKYGTIQCSPSHVICYQRFGLRNILPIVQYSHPIWGARQLMYGHYKSYSEHFKPLIDKFCESLVKKSYCNLNLRS